MQWEIIKLRKELNLTQEDMANLLDISTGAYSRKETGKCAFKDIEMFKLRNLFKKPIDEIFLPTYCTENAKMILAVAE